MAEMPSDPKQAMARVLQAEQEAEQAVDACEQQARTILEEAQQRAGRIASRTAERITIVKMRSAQQLAGEIKRRDKEEEKAYEQRLVELDETGLSECITDVARILTGGGPGE
jgi:CRISPR/Cas system CSM-associated protein Csm2 small subunit